MPSTTDGTSVARLLTGKAAFQTAVVALLYFGAARIGLEFDAVGGFATLVWPASGIALAALLLGGYRLWPAVTIGAFAANFSVGAPVLAAAGISAGNTAEALAGAYLVTRFAGFRCNLERVRDVLALIILAAGLSATIAATVGSVALISQGVIDASGFGAAWKAWWLGDAIGILLATPLILVWSTGAPRSLRANAVVEIAALAATIAAAGVFVFSAYSAAEQMARGREYMLFPPLIWAALRFGIRGAVTSSVAVAIIAIAYTAAGHGPFIRADMYENLLALQIFVGIVGGTFLVLGASISERRKAATELEGARETAETANRAKSGFLAVVSHELRTPLNAIMGYVELLLLELEGPLTEKQRGTLERIRQSQRHLLALIEDVLGFAQVEAGRLSFSLQPVSVRDSLIALEAIVGQERIRKEVNVRMSNPDPELYVQADPDKLRQVLLNLVTNAIKFTPKAGEISVSAFRKGDDVIFVVTDTGIGIAADNLSRVFDPFFQVDQGGTRRYPGVGLGLSIVRDAVLAMNGDIAIESELGKGTKVTVTLPAASGGAGAKASVAPPSLLAENSTPTLSS